MTDLRKWILPAGMVAVTALVALHGAVIPGPSADRKPAPAAEESAMEAAPPDEETGESLRGNRSWFEWILYMEKSFGRGMNRAAKRKMLTHHLQALYLQDVVRREYFSGAIDWDHTVAAVKDLLAWDDAAYRELLTDEQYGKLTALKKDPPDDVGDGLWRPSGRGRSFTSFRVSGNRTRRSKRRKTCTSGFPGKKSGP